MSRRAGEPLPKFIEPMLARAGEPRRSRRFVAEVKWDGVRAIVRVDRGEVSVRSRRRWELTESFPEVRAIATALGRWRRVLLDGELVVCAPTDGKPDFERLPARMRRRGPEARRAASAVPAIFMAFDVLSLDGEAVRERPYGERREVLERLELHGAAWRCPEAFACDEYDLHEATRLGVVYKRVDEPYRAGARSWVKAKHRRAELLDVIAWRPGEGEPDTLYVGRPRAADGARYAGAVQFGLDAERRRALRVALRGRQRPATPRRRTRDVGRGIQLRVAHHGRPGGVVRDPVIRALLIDGDEA